mmetsp:Transcript_11306/g.23074  ORF Transcript_11306/g.23074 Transcript_11306/m.23074 type:complete len:246 (-) Transcript_11306:1100-1837(-)
MPRHLMRNLYIVHLSPFLCLPLLLFLRNLCNMGLEIGNGTIFQISRLFVVAHPLSCGGFSFQTRQFFLCRLQFLSPPTIRLPFLQKRFELFSQIGDFSLDVFAFVLRYLILLASKCRGFNLKLENLSLEHIDLLWTTIQLHTTCCRGLVHKIDAFVGIEPSRDVSIRELSRRDDGSIGNADTVMSFVAIRQSAQNADSRFHGRLFDLNFLEAAFEGCILFDVLTIFFSGCCSDHAEFSSCQHRLQ